MTRKAILLVEDNESDAFFMTTALEQVGVSNPVYLVKDGREALDYLSGLGKYADRLQHPVPYLILLDMKLPLLMGLDLLKWVRQRAEFSSTIVVIVSSSPSPDDVDAAYRLGANAYLVKPTGMARLHQLAKALKDFWLVENQPATAFLEQ
jgi:CheY-like chemotaxis protein